MHNDKAQYKLQKHRRQNTAQLNRDDANICTVQNMIRDELRWNTMT